LSAIKHCNRHVSVAQFSTFKFENVCQIKQIWIYYIELHMHAY